MSQKKEIIRIYKKEDIARTFDGNRSKYLYQIYKHKIESDFLKKSISSISPENVRVLDVACGTGRMLPEIFKTKKQIEYIGLDSSNKMLKELKKKDVFKKNEKDISLILSDAVKLPFKNNSFDIVYSYHLLWHLEKDYQKKIILEMKRVTKKQGIIIFDILNKNFVWEKSKKYFGREKTEGLYKQTLSEVKKILGKIEHIKIEKLSDATIRNDNIYKLFNIVNIIRIFLPSSFFHMIYFKIKK